MSAEMNNYKKNKLLLLPDSAFYIPNFITTEEEQVLIEKIYSSPKPKWKILSNRRLQNWGGLPHQKGMIQEELPQWLCACIQKVNKLQCFEEKVPNHVLVNEYLPGQGIMPHEDGPLFYPTIATINLGSHTVLDYYEKPKCESNEQVKLPLNDHEEMQNLSSRFVGSLLLERCSLLIVCDDLYHKYLHGIKEQSCDILSDNVKNLELSQWKLGSMLDRETRISLTIRHVPNIVKAKFLLKAK